MDYADIYGVLIALALVIGTVLDHRRKRSAEDFERKRRDRKAEVERAARKAL
ncbi:MULTISPECIES: hypothetical protein [Pseudomonas]|uniref:Uncharacterized protein n=1 Tax=Pseudomonas carnis TaxID=2487355 RepID=A0ABT5RQH8_9PSED|nr:MULTISPECIES: hypothetical protein [Pseudomonas]MDD1947756.1 hypothetical protein [Pseudomonas carnis]